MDNQLTPLRPDDAAVMRAYRELTRVSINLALVSRESDDALRQDTLRSFEIAVEQLNQAWSRFPSRTGVAAREVA